MNKINIKLRNYGIVFAVFLAIGSVRGEVAVIKEDGYSARLFFRRGVVFRNNNTRNLTLNGGIIRAETEANPIHMGPLIVRGWGGEFYANGGEFLFPTTNIWEGATFTVREDSYLNLGKLSCVGNLKVIGRNSEITLTGKCRKMSLTRPAKTHPYYTNPRLIVGAAGASMGTLTLNTGTLIMHGPLTVNTLEVNNAMRLDNRTNGPIVAKQGVKITGNQLFTLDGRKSPAPLTLIREAPLTSEFVIIDNQGPDPVQVSAADKIKIEADFPLNNQVTIFPPTDESPGFGQNFRVTLTGGDGNDVAVYAVPWHE